VNLREEVGKEACRKRGFKWKVECVTVTFECGRENGGGMSKGEGVK